MEEEILHVEEPSQDSSDQSTLENKEHLESAARDALGISSRLQKFSPSLASQNTSIPLGFPFHRKTGKVRLPRERDGFSSSEEELSDDSANMCDQWQVRLLH